MRTIVLLLIYIIYGCNHGYTDQTNNERGESCSVSDNGTISCPDGTSYQIPAASPGVPGHDGEDGDAGQDGASGDRGPIGQPGRDGQTIVGPRGPQGEPGPVGFVGPAGVAGTSCTVSDTGLITCGDTSYQVPSPSPGPQGEQGPAGSPGPSGSNGENGSDGAQGPSGQEGAPGTPGTVIYPVFPCPQLGGAYPEVLLCIANQLYAVFDPSTGTNNIRYVQVGPGSYRSTDGRDCSFIVTSGCEIQ